MRLLQIIIQNLAAALKTSIIQKILLTIILILSNPLKFQKVFKWSPKSLVYLSKILHKRQNYVTSSLRSLNIVKVKILGG